MAIPLLFYRIYFSDTFFIKHVKHPNSGPRLTNFILMSIIKLHLTIYNMTQLITILMINVS